MTTSHSKPTKDEALKLALEALQDLIGEHYGEKQTVVSNLGRRAVFAIREALAQPAADDKATEWHDEKPDKWTPLIEAAHPLKTKNYKAWDTAIQMVGNRRNKHALVELVCWLLQRADDKAGGEVVAVVDSGLAGGIGWTEAGRDLEDGQELFTRPQPQAELPAERVALTTEQIQNIRKIAKLSYLSMPEISLLIVVRAVEEAHGITGKGQP